MSYTNTAKSTQANKSIASEAPKAIAPEAIEAPETVVTDETEMTESEVDAMIEAMEAADRLEQKRAKLAAMKLNNASLKSDRVIAEAKAKQAEIAVKSEATAAHAKSIRLQTEAELKDAAIKSASDELLPLVTEAIQEQAAHDLAKEKRSITTITDAAKAASEIESAQELRAKKLLAQTLAEANTANEEIKNIVQNGVQAVNRLQLQSAQPEVATAFGATQKMPQTAATATIDI